MKKRVKRLLFVYLLMFFSIIMFNDILNVFAQEVTSPNEGIWKNFYVGAVVKSGQILYNVGRYDYSNVFNYRKKDGSTFYDEYTNPCSHWDSYPVLNSYGVEYWIITEISYDSSYFMSSKLNKVTFQELDAQQINYPSDVTVDSNDVASFNVSVNGSCSADSYAYDWYYRTYENVVPQAAHSSFNVEDNGDNTYNLKSDSNSFYFDNVLTPGSLLSYTTSAYHEIYDTDKDTGTYLEAMSMNLSSSPSFLIPYKSDIYIGTEVYYPEIKNLKILKAVDKKVGTGNQLKLSKSVNSTYFKDDSYFYAKITDCDGQSYNSPVVQLKVNNVVSSPSPSSGPSPSSSSSPSPSGSPGNSGSANPVNNPKTLSPLYALVVLSAIGLGGLFLTDIFKKKNN